MFVPAPASPVRGSGERSSAASYPLPMPRGLRPESLQAGKLMNECRSAFCFHVISASDAALRIASKNQALLCGHTRSALRGAIASQRARLSAIGTIRRVAVFALCAATSMNPGRRSTSDHSRRKISSARSPANAARAKHGAILWRSVFQHARQARRA